MVLKGIGYWDIYGNDKLQVIKQFIDFDWDMTKRKNIISILEKIEKKQSLAASSYCECEMNSGCIYGNIDMSIYSNGEYIWPISILHYVKYHGLRLPSEFVNSITENQNLIYREKPDFKIDYSWYLKYKDFNKEKKYVNTLGKVVLRLITSKITSDVLNFIKSFKCYKNKTNIEIYKLLKENGNKIIIDEIRYFEFFYIMYKEEDLNFKSEFLTL